MSQKKDHLIPDFRPLATRVGCIIKDAVILWARHLDALAHARIESYPSNFLYDALKDTDKVMHGFFTTAWPFQWEYVRRLSRVVCLWQPHLIACELSGGDTKNMIAPISLPCFVDTPPTLSIVCTTGRYKRAFGHRRSTSLGYHHWKSGGRKML